VTVTYRQFYLGRKVMRWPFGARVCTEIVSLPLQPRMEDEDAATMAAAALGGQTSCSR
jgi:dTDP-4-amino-4,6-dideoxygalactose transaminase